MFITTFELFQPESHWEPRNEVGFLSPAERLVGFESQTFRFLIHSQSVHTLKLLICISLQKKFLMRISLFLLTLTGKKCFLF